MLEYIEETMGCKLYWRKRSAKSPLEDCSTSDHFRQFQQILRSFMYLGEDQYYNITKCVAPCTYFHYNLKNVSDDLVKKVFLFTFETLMFTDKFFVPQ